ncbi:Cell wall-associated hydrolase, NlpC family [Pseudobutyrivibrio sp. YE44]|uniref:C40 family peptidase n=1 Tax=Pseudobutyrivibrio sp. YE44 TaxID=1520802 RepID=UPI000889B38C|nr:C40 family peptidase [Pseudobutyrivibrio sp. YE44]SDB06869.1 Cell wall-associated hydrolase, NlpC family [Pseudobutyrivibrio sp. YE44]
MYDYNKDENVGGEALDLGVDTGRLLHDESKRIIKKRIKRAQIRKAQEESAKAAAKSARASAEASKKLAEESAKLVKLLFGATKKVITSIIAFIVDNPVVLIVIAVILALFLLYKAFSSAITSYMSGMGEGVLMGTYTAYDDDIIGVNSDYSKLEKELQKTINNTERDFPGYDEYEYRLEEIGHNPYELISYLTVMYENFTRAEMKQVVKDLFNEQYDLRYSQRTETRTRTVTKYKMENGSLVPYEDTETYTVTILRVTLSNRGLGNVIASKPLTNVQKARYDLLMETQGNKPDLLDDLYTDVEIPDEYEVPPESLTDQTFASMISEAEKYLGRAYVWGGSSPSSGFDCSGFVCWVLNHSGWSVGRTDCNGLKSKCTIVSPEEAKPGDLIFFKGTQKSKRGATHVGIYCGNGIMIHCGNPIQYTSINTKYYQNHFLCYGRLPEN